MKLDFTRGPDESGSTSTSRLREKTVYKWYGIYRIEGDEENLGRLLRLVGKPFGVELLDREPSESQRYKVIVAPVLGHYLPSQAENYLPDQGERVRKELLRRVGGRVNYLGAFYIKPQTVKS